MQQGNEAGQESEKSWEDATKPPVSKLRKKRAEKGRRKKHTHTHRGGVRGGGRDKEMLECLPCLASKLMIPEAGEPFSWKQQ